MKRITVWCLSVLFLSVLFFRCTKSESKEEESNAGGEVASEYLTWAERMADSDIKRNPDAWMLDFNKKPRWNYTHGVVCSAMEDLWKHTGDEKYYNYILTYADTMIDEDGSILTYHQDDYNIDMINSGKFLFGVYEKTQNPKYKKAIELLRDQMRKHPRTSEGGFWHKKRYPHQMWLDGIYMGSPFLAEYAATFGEDSLFDDVANQIHLINVHTRDSVTGLYYHGWDESHEQKWADPKTGLSANFWGRGMGWYAMALVDVLDYLPKDHPKRDEILDIAKEMAKAIVDYQDEESGVWYQVLDKPDKEGNYKEASVSTMFVYFLAKAVRKGYIDDKYMDAALKGYKGILDEFVKVDDNGEVELTKICAGAGLGGNPYRDGSFDYYVNETIRANDPKGVGPFIMLCLELDKYQSQNS